MRGHPGVPARPDPRLRIVLVEPEIPGNTGAVGRLAMATGCPLHLVEPLGFEVDDARLRRAGLDYWKSAEVYYHPSLDEVLSLHAVASSYFLSSHAERPYTDIPFRRGDLLVFGKETCGLPRELLRERPDRCFRIPLEPGARSLNLAMAVAIVTFEGLRQLGALAETDRGMAATSP